MESRRRRRHHADVRLAADPRRGPDRLNSRARDAAHGWIATRSSRSCALPRASRRARPALRSTGVAGRRRVQRAPRDRLLPRGRGRGPRCAGRLPRVSRAARLPGVRARASRPRRHLGRNDGRGALRARKRRHSADDLLGATREMERKRQQSAEDLDGEVERARQRLERARQRLEEIFGNSNATTSHPADAVGSSRKLGRPREHKQTAPKPLPRWDARRPLTDGPRATTATAGRAHRERRSRPPQLAQARFWRAPARSGREKRADVTSQGWRPSPPQPS